MTMHFITCIISRSVLFAWFFFLIIGYISPLLCIPGDMWLDARHHDIVIFALLTLVQNQCTVCFFCQYINILKPCFVMNIKLLRNKILSVLGFKLHQLGLEQHDTSLLSSLPDALWMIMVYHSDKKCSLPWVGTAVLSVCSFLLSGTLS